MIKKSPSHCRATVPGRLALLLLCALAVLVAGCSAPAPTGTDDALAIVVGAHADAPAPTPGGAVAQAIDRAVQGQAWAAVVVDSGTPSVASQGQLGRNCNNSASCAQATQTNTALLDSTISTARAGQPEANLLAAIDLGARTLADHHGGKTLAVIDSGLQTLPPLRFQDAGVLTAAPQEVADYLQQTHALPALTGETVIFAGLGDTAPPQTPLSPAQRDNLQAIWSAVAHRAGAVDVQFVRAPLTSAPASGLPPVTPVPTGAPLSFTAPTIDLTDAVLPFRHDSAMIVDPAAASATLSALAAQLVASHAHLQLTGATANVGPLDGQRALGRARAKAIAAILVDRLHVPATLVTVVGVGSDWPGYVPDHDAAGHLLPGPAAENRRVVARVQQS